MQVNPSSPVSRSPEVVRRPSPPTTSTSGAVSGAVGKFVPPVLPTISARDIQPMGGYPVPDIGRFIKKCALPLMVLAITVMAYLQEKATTEGSAAMPRSTAMGQPEQILSGALMFLGLQNPELILFTAAVAFMAQAPGAEAASTTYKHFPAWIKGCSNVPTYGTTGIINCELNTQSTAGKALLVGGEFPGHGMFSVRGDVPYANPTTTVDTTTSIPSNGKVQIDLNNPVVADHDRSLAGCVRRAMTYFRLCLVPQNAGPAATLGYDYTGAIKNPYGMVDAQQLADKLNGGSGPECATVYRPVDTSGSHAINRFGEDFYIKDSCGLMVGPGGLFSSGNVEKLSNGGVRLHYRPDENNKWAGGEMISVDRNLGFGELSVTMGGIPSEQMLNENRIIRSPFLWSDQPRLDQLKPGDKFGWPLKEEWGNPQQELDFEIGKFGDPNHSPAQFAVQHWNIPGNVKPIYPNTAEAMIFNLSAQKNSVRFGLTQAGQETAWNYTNSKFIPESLKVGLTINIWNSGHANPLTQSPSNGIRQWLDILDVKLPPANASVTSASPTGAPESGASSAISGGGIAGIAVGGVVGLGVVAGLAYARFRRAAAEPQQPARDASPNVLNQVELQPASVVSIPGSGHVVVDVAALQQPAREVASDPLNDVVIELPEVGDAEPQPPASDASSNVLNEVVVELQPVDGAELQRPAGVASTPVPDDHVGDAELPQTAIEVSPQVTAQVVGGQDV